MNRPELDPRIEPPHSYIVIFSSAASLHKAQNWLTVISDFFSIIKPTMIALKIGLSAVDLVYVINREGAFDFRIIEIDDIELVDNRSNDERLNDILETISSRGYELLLEEDKLFLQDLASTNL